MAKGVRAIVAAAALGMGLLGAAGSARADQEYNFRFYSNDPGNLDVVGQFGLNGPLIDSVNADFHINGQSTSYNVNQVQGASFIAGSWLFGLTATNGVNGNFLFFNGILNQSGNSYSGQVNVIAEGSGTYVASQFGSFFAELLSPSAPSGGGSSSSGGAPSPEVNTLLGFLIVGGTVAFLKRKRKGGGAEDAAAA